MQEGGGGDEPLLLHAAAFLQCCSLSPGQKIVLLHNPRPCTITGRGHGKRASQRAMLCMCVHACEN